MKITFRVISVDGGDFIIRYKWSRSFIWYTYDGEIYKNMIYFLISSSFEAKTFNSRADAESEIKWEIGNLKKMKLMRVKGKRNEIVVNEMTTRI